MSASTGLPPPAHEALQQQLWPRGEAATSSVWAVLDCARDSRIYLALLASRLEFRCLYAGRLPRELEMVAPQLVELHPGHRLTLQLLEEGWAQAWGILLRTREPDNLRHHLRKLLTVQDTLGRRLLFRFYDPRVLRSFLPSCSPEQLAQFFGAVDSFWMESGDGSQLLRMSRQRGLLQVQPFAGPRAPANPEAGTC